MAFEIFVARCGGHAGLKPADDGNSDRCAAHAGNPDPELLLVHDGDPVVGPDKPLGAVELRGGHADDRKGMLVELDGRADTPGSA